MSQKRNQKHVARKQREEQQADRVIKGLFIGLIALAVIAIVCFSVWG